MDPYNEYSKVDPKDAKILALTTRLENLEKSTNANSAHATTGGGGGGNNLQGVGRKNNNPTGNMTGQIATWRTINKGPTSTAPDGTTVYWCPNNVHPQGLFNGSYNWHKPEDHNSWKAALNARKASKKGYANTTDATTTAASQQGMQKLAISQRLKEVLCSNLMMSDTDSDDICKEACASKDQARSWEYGIKQDILSVSYLLHCSNWPN